MVLTSISAWSQLTLTSVTPIVVVDGDQSCATIELQLDGTAGPFTVQLLDATGAVVIDHPAQFGTAVLSSSTLDAAEAAVLCTPGDYSLQVLNRFGCEVKIEDISTGEKALEIPIRLDGCPDLGDIDFEIISYPEDCEDDNGTIVIAKEVFEQFNINLYNEEGANLPVSEFGDEYYWDALYFGVYTLHVSSSSCEDIVPITVDLRLLPNLKPTILETCFRQENGVIDFSGLGTAASYTYTWDDGAIGNKRINLKAGNYCVQMSGPGIDCAFERCYTVPVIIAPQIDVVDRHNPNTQEDSNGSITLAERSSQNLNYQWSNGQTGPSLQNVAAGTYTVTITNEQGCSFEQTYTINSCYTVLLDPDYGTEIGLEANFEDFDIALTGGYLATGAPSTDVKLNIKKASEAIYSSNTQGYSIEWELENNGDIQHGGNTYNVDRSEFDFGKVLRVAVKVSNGCTSKTTSIILFSCEFATPNSQSYEYFIRGVVKPCPGAADGLLNIRIPNLDDILPSVFVNDLPQAVNLGNLLDYESTAQLLQPGIQNVVIDFGDCQISFDYELEEAESEKVYAGYDKESNVCIYDQLCNDNLLGNLTSEAGLYDYVATEERFGSKCYLPIKCNDNVVDYQSTKYITMRAGEYTSTLRYLLDNPNLFTNNGMYEEILTWLQIYRGRWHPCEKIKICPYSFRPRKLASGVPDPTLFFKEREDPTWLGGGCYGINCIFSNPTFCVGDVELPFLNDTGDDPFNDCDGVSVNAYQLMSHYRENVLQNIYNERFPDADFKETSLYNDFIRIYEFDERLPCASLVFCRDDEDFKLLYTDINTIFCGGTNYETFEVTFFENGEAQSQVIKVPDDCETFAYPDPGLDNLKFVHCYGSNNIEAIDLLDYSYLDLGATPAAPPTSYPLSRPHIKVTQESELDETITNLGLYVTENGILPKGFISNTNNDSILIYDYDHGVERISNIEGGDIKHFVDNQDLEQEIFMFRNPDNILSEKLTYSDTISGWEKYLSSSKSLNSTFLSSQNGYIHIGGTFSENLNFDGVDLINTQNDGAFTLSIDKAGQLLNYQIIEGTLGKVDFAERPNGDLTIAFQPLAGGVGFYENGTLNTIIVNPVSSIYLINQNTTASTTSLNPISTHLDLELNDISISPSTGQIAIVAAQTNDPTGAVGCNQDMYLLTTDQNGILQWSQTWINSCESGKAQVAYGEQDELFLSLTYQDTLVIDTAILVSKGGEDIAVFKFKASGEMQFYRSYGTRDKENVKHLFYNSGVLYFAGEYDGLEAHRPIGNYDFFNFAAAKKRAYISYIFDERPSNQTTANKQTHTTPKLDPNILALDFQAIPNPFTDQLTLQLNAAFAESVQYLIYNELGKVVQRGTIDLHKGQNQYELSTSDLDVGIYFIEIEGKKNSYPQSQKVIKVK